MPKELFEINQFESGNYYTPDDRDIPDDAAVYSENIDPYGQDGSLRAIHEDDTPIMASVDANRMAIINDEGTHRLVFVDRSDGDMMKVDDIYGTPVLSELESGSFAGVDDIPAMQVNNKEVHIGLGSGTDDKPKWVGVIPHGQFNTAATSGLQITDAELKNPSPFPVMHKIVASTDNKYVYGHTLNGNYIFKFEVADGVVEKRSEYYFSSIRSIALASDGNLWVADLVGTDLTILKVDSDIMDAISSRPLNTFSNDTGITDIEQQGNTLWLAAGNDVHTAEDFFYNISVTNLTTSSSPGRVDNRSPYIGTLSGGYAEGEWAAYNPAIPGMMPPQDNDMHLPRLPLIKVTDSNSYMGLFCRPVNANNSSLYVSWFNSSTSTDFIGWDGSTNSSTDVNGKIVWFVQIVKDDISAGSKLGDLATKGEVLACSSEFDTDYDETFQAKQNDGSDKLTITTTGTFSSSQTSIYYLNKIAYDDANTTIAGTVARLGVGTDVDIEEAVATEIGESFNIFSGTNAVRWSAGTAGNLVKKLEGQVAIAIANNSLVNGSLQPAVNDLFYATSFIYDGYQESPLSDWTRIDKNDFSQDSLNVTLNIFPAELSPRITHINLYRSDATGSTARPTEFFRLVKSISIKTGWGAIDSNTANPDWGDFYEKSIIDDGASFASYEARTGISEALRYTLPNYGLSTKINNFLYIADCSHPDIEDASYYLFKSRPFNYDQFNWIRDSLILPEKPTALESFNGRVFVFSESNCYIVNPDGLYIEDTIEGVGCVNQNLVKSSDVGLCVMDNNSVYLHNGQGFADIGARIKSNYQSTTSFQQSTSIDRLVQFNAPSGSPTESIEGYVGKKVMAYDYYRKSFYIFFTTKVRDFTSTFDLTVNVTSGSEFISYSGTSPQTLEVGAVVSGNGIPEGTTIVDPATSSTNFEISNFATDNFSGDITIQYGVTIFKSYALVFTVPKARWDTWTRTHASGSDNEFIVHGSVNGKKGEVFTSDSESGLIQPFNPHNSSRVDSFLWYSKKFTMGQSTVDKKFFEVGLVSEDGGGLDTKVNATENNETFTTLTTPITGRDIQLKIENTLDSSSSVNSARIVYRRRRPVKAMT